ncbi:hypothetical protein F4776DRAFT_637053 [Hypoxylon sp. NC0597]|nr:hypothetical protein F4776DRAFT_637053 [Hypoxylon sp. NC0597]
MDARRGIRRVLNVPIAVKIAIVIVVLLHVLVYDCWRNPEQTYPQKPNSTAPSTYYDVLGIPLFSSDEAVRSAYRLQAKIHHPDKVKAGDKERATEEMVRINKAYEFLSSRDRCLYDLKLGSSVGDFTSCQARYSKRDLENFMRKREEDRKERQNKFKAEMDREANKKGRWGRNPKDEQKQPEDTDGKKTQHNENTASERTQPKRDAETDSKYSVIDTRLGVFNYLGHIARESAEVMVTLVAKFVLYFQRWWLRG